MAKDDAAQALGASTRAYLKAWKAQAAAQADSREADAALRSANDALSAATAPLLSILPDDGMRERFLECEGFLVTVSRAAKGSPVTVSCAPLNEGKREQV